MSIFFFIFYFFGFMLPDSQSPVPQEVKMPVQADIIISIDAMMEEALAENRITGAVVLIGHGDEIVVEKAYGRKSPSPDGEKMTSDTLFDLASLTKVIATAPSIMCLYERGKIKLDAPLSRCLPEAGTKSHASITVRQLLTHYSGLTATIFPERRGRKKTASVSGKTLIEKIYTAPLEAKPGTAFVYSDIGYVLLGKTVERASGVSLDRFAAQNIFKPLKMDDTCYRPEKTKINRIAFSEEQRRGCYLRGTVQDPISGQLKGVTGHAGLFSTAHDLSRFSRMMINGGILDGQRILSSETVALMTAQQSPQGKDDIRGFGWDIDSRYSSVKGVYFPPQSYGHTGYTGTSLWIDPESKTYVILLTCRQDLSVNTAIISLRKKISDYAGSLYYPIPLMYKGI